MDNEITAATANLNIACTDLLNGYDSVVTHHGYLHKKTKVLQAIQKIKAQKLFKWPKRYVVISQGCIYMYNDGQSKKPSTAISLYGYNRVSRAGEILFTEAPNAFKIEGVHAKHFKTYFFACPSERDMKTWMLKIKEAMLLANGKSPSSGSPSPAPLLRHHSLDSISYGAIEESVYSAAEDIDSISAKIDSLRGRHKHAKSRTASKTSNEEEEIGSDDSDYNEIDDVELDEMRGQKEEELMRRHSGRPLPPPPAGALVRSPSQDGPDGVYECADEKEKIDRRFRGIRALPNLPEEAQHNQNSTSRRPIPTPDQINNAPQGFGNVRDRANRFEASGHRPAKPPPGSKPVIPGLGPPSPAKRSPIATTAPALPSRVPHTQAPPVEEEDEQFDYMKPLGDLYEEMLLWKQVCQPDQYPDAADKYWKVVYLPSTGGNATILLTDIGKEGTYLVRDSQQPGEYTLCVWTSGAARKYKISHNQNNRTYYIKQGVEFSTIQEMLAFYHDNDLPNRENAKLMMPYKT